MILNRIIGMGVVISAFLVLGWLTVQYFSGPVCLESHEEEYYRPSYSTTMMAGETPIIIFYPGGMATRTACDMYKEVLR